MRYKKLLTLLVAADGGQGFVSPPISYPAGTNGPQQCSHGGYNAGARSGSSARTSCGQQVGKRQRNPATARVATRQGASSPAANPAGDFFLALFGGRSSSKVGINNQAAIKLEAKLLSAIGAVQGRGRGATQEQREAVDKAVTELEANGGVNDAALSPLVDGNWRLVFTTTPGTASPVQRSFVGVDGFAIYQDIDLFAEDAPPTVTNVVDFGPRVGQLRVTALASTMARPLKDFVPRRGDGRFFGLNILGVSQTTLPKDPNARIDFQFDEAGFELKALPFNIPYPVPFRWLGDEVKGWIDVTYLSDRLRIARGNKGTLFVLQRPDMDASSSTSVGAA